jgi:hypothetical protein
MIRANEAVIACPCRDVIRASEAVTERTQRHKSLTIPKARVDGFVSQYTEQVSSCFIHFYWIKGYKPVWEWRRVRMLNFNEHRLYHTSERTLPRLQDDSFKPRTQIESIVTDLINALPGNSSLNTFQQTPRKNGEICIFYMVTLSQETVFSVWSVRILHKEDVL